jgi:hypothetical protein
MGMNNKQRRATKARAKDRGRRDDGGSGFLAQDCADHGARCPSGPDRSGLRERVTLQLVLVEAMRQVVATPAEALRAAREVLARVDARSHGLFVTESFDLVDGSVQVLVGNGWTPDDLREITRRRAGPRLCGVLADSLARHVAGCPGDLVEAQWRAQVVALGEPVSVDPLRAEGLAQLLALAGALDRLPRLAEVLPPPGRRDARHRSAAGAGASSEFADKQLARVRALLAKAESTEYDAEAEALTAKAQELISRHALERLLGQLDSGVGVGSSIGARRIWLDAPYLLAKGMLVNAVATANRSRAVISETLGCCTLVGAPRDLDAVELLSTSLLVQANVAMLRHGRQVDRGGTSRTRSFRQSFLIAYAGRIGERLTATDQSAVREAPHADRLLPVLRATQEAVEAEFARLFPSLTTRSTTIGDARGWAAGRAAADLSLLDVYGKLTAEAG